MSIIKSSPYAPTPPAATDALPAATVPPAGTPPAAPPAAGDRPEWAPEKFWDPEKKSVRAEDLARSYRELETWKGTKTDELKAALKSEVEAELFKERPEAADKYEPPKFEDDRIDHEALNAHPLIGWWREQAFTKGMSQGEFQAGVKQYVDALVADLPDPKKELEKIGDNAPARQQAVSLWAQQTFKDANEFNAIQRLAVTADGFKAVERLMNQIKGGNYKPQDNADPGPQHADLSEAEVRSLMQKPEYWNPSKRDPAIVKKVEDWHKRQYK